MPASWFPETTELVGCLLRHAMCDGESKICGDLENLVLGLAGAREKAYSDF